MLFNFNDANNRRIHFILFFFTSINKLIHLVYEPKLLCLFSISLVPFCIYFRRRFDPCYYDVTILSSFLTNSINFSSCNFARTSSRSSFSFKQSSRTTLVEISS